jgi:cation diffusion facilitator CzcD-associated flavoprotein CzcO
VANGLEAERIRVAVVGSGFAGLGAAIALKRAGFDDIVILERADDVGGVWRDNTYPGAACDVQSPVYAFSFAPSTEWNYLFAPQDEIHDYLRSVATDFGLTPDLRLNCPVEEARWDTSASLWRLTTPAGQIQAEHLVVATGALADPTIPEVPGLDRFTGSVFHSARWDHNVDLRGKRVAVIGTGASAIQFVPTIQPLVEQLTLFQRTPPWVMPRHDRPISARERALRRALPPLRLAQRTSIYVQRELTVAGFRHPVLMKLVERTARKHLQSQVSDPQLRAKLTPNYRLGCKRILLSNDYLASVDQPNADVITSGIREVTADAVMDNDGTLHRVDAIILGGDIPVRRGGDRRRRRRVGHRHHTGQRQANPRRHRDVLRRTPRPNRSSRPGQRRAGNRQPRADLRQRQVPDQGRPHLRRRRRDRVPGAGRHVMEQGRLAAYHVFGKPTARMTELQPIGIFSIPEVSYVGATEVELTTDSIGYEVGVSRYRELARGQIAGDSYGMLKLLVSTDDLKLLGVHVFGTNATELVHIGQAVMGCGGTIEYLVDAVFNYPTFAEAYKVAALDVMNKMRTLSQLRA